MIDFTLQVEMISPGVKVAALSRKFLRSASIIFLVGRGSYEDPMAGCAYLANHMRLRLTSKLSPLKLQAAIDRLGATVDAATDRDLMMLRAQVPAKRVAECLEFLADLYMSPSFVASEVAKEKTAQGLEYQKIRQDPIAASVENAWEATFPKNPLGHPVTGYPDTIERLTPPMLEEYDANTKEKAPIVVGIVGPQPEKRLVSFAESSLRKIKIRPSVGKLAKGSSKDFNVLSQRLDVKQTTFSIGMATPGMAVSEYYSLLLLEDYLGSYTRHYAGVLHEELREKRGLTYFTTARMSSMKDLGLLIAFAGVRHEKVTEALRVMLKLIVETREKPIPERTLNHLKTFHKYVIETMLEVPYQAAIWVAQNAFRGGNADPESYSSELGAVSSEAVRMVAEAFLTPSRMALSVAGNPPNEEALIEIMKEEVE